MISKIKEFFTQNISQPEDHSEEQKIDRIAIATCALLLEMAHADAQFSEVEEKEIINILKRFPDRNYRRRTYVVRDFYRHQVICNPRRENTIAYS